MTALPPPATSTHATTPSPNSTRKTGHSAPVQACTKYQAQTCPPRPHQACTRCTHLTDRKPAREAPATAKEVWPPRVALRQEQYVPMGIGAVSARSWAVQRPGARRASVRRWAMRFRGRSLGERVGTSRLRYMRLDRAIFMSSKLLSCTSRLVSCCCVSRHPARLGCPVTVSQRSTECGGSLLSRSSPACRWSRSRRRGGHGHADDCQLMPTPRDLIHEPLNRPGTVVLAATALILARVQLTQQGWKTACCSDPRVLARLQNRLRSRSNPCWTRTRFNRSMHHAMNYPGSG